jgi:hypothetical protein
MASTRNKNTSSDYCLQQRSYHDARKYMEYEYSQVGRAYTNAIPCVGITPSRMPREAFSSNSVEIESALFGINATKLVNPQAPIVPSLIRLSDVSYFDRLPIYMPEPLVVEKNQRPFPRPK